MVGSLEQRFWAKVDKDGPIPEHRPKLGPCWAWTADIINMGYGRIGRDGKTALAHRVAYELLIGPIPDGLELDHLCHNRACVNPKHLEPVTHRENMRRSKALKTHCPKGHSYTTKNTYIRRPSGSRGCRICRRAWGSGSRQAERMAR